jgi:3-deoxy-7-phosphoheptulonate synthase
MRPPVLSKTTILQPLPTPASIADLLPPGSRSAATVQRARDEIRDIIHGRDQRLLVIAGPCSIHDPIAAVDYAERLLKLRMELADSLCIVMRTYLEKPRTEFGWKGLINDPDLDGSCDIIKGIIISRRLLLNITDMGLPTATEILDPLLFAYTGDLISWASIGARTVTSPLHRHAVSGIDVPVGIKNSVDGNLRAAASAMKVAGRGHSYTGVDGDGQACLVTSSGNPDCHLVLRGGEFSANHDARSVRDALEVLRSRDLNESIIVDCSHMNSRKEHHRQTAVCEEVVRQRCTGTSALRGVMIESAIAEGCQRPDESPLRYGVSITDPCMGWDRTEDLLRGIALTIQEENAQNENGLMCGSLPIGQEAPSIVAG